MYKRTGCLILLASLFICLKSYCQPQDVEFHLNAHLLNGKKILKVKRDFYDPYLWVLAANNEIYRVNSLTQAIDDYTSAFSVYNSLQFIDIAGRSRDTVFVATNSTNVIALKNGALSEIGGATGITGTVNSVGIAGGRPYNSVKTAAIVMIATDKGFFFYNSDTGTLTNRSFNTQDISSYSKVYQANWRTQMYRDSSSGTMDEATGFVDTLNYQPATFLPDGIGTYVGFLWEGGQSFGYNIQTADVIYQSIYAYNPVFTNMFWGNNRGLFQINWYFSNSSDIEAYGHYLNGINVNKIENIYGLTAFGSGASSGTNIKQNLLIGTDNGLYFSSSVYQQTDYALKTFSLFHDDELGNMVINDICVNAARIDAPICEDGVWLAANDGLYLIKPDYAKYFNAQTLKAINFQNLPDSVVTICSGDSINAVVNPQAYTGNTIQWYKDGNELPLQSHDTLAIKAPGDYYALLYDPCEGVHVESNHLTVTTTTGPVFTFNYPDKIQQCVGTAYILKVEQKSGYSYRWYTNGSLNGDTNSSFTVNQSGQYKVEVSACSNSWVPSKQVEVDLITLPVPVIKLDKPAYCIGDNATLSINTMPAPSYTINWYKDNILLTDYTDLNSITTSTSGNYTISIISNSINTDGSTCLQTSNIQPLVFNTLPDVSIEQIVKTTLCEGQTAYLTAHHTDGTVEWSTGENTDQIAVTTAGKYKVTVTTPAGCQQDTSIEVNFFNNPALNIKDTTICTYKREPIILTAPAGFVQYEWNGVAGPSTYQINGPQAINLIVTDANGCQASQTINVTEQCPDIWIPNTFTPNNDGINDTWVILGLDNDQTVSVRIFNRYGIQVYESKGYPKPWDGEYSGKKLPTGVYYYIVTAKNNTQKFSGALTIIY